MIKHLLRGRLAYTAAARSRCSGRTFCCGCSRYLARLITTASRHAGRRSRPSIASSATAAARRSGGSSIQTRRSGVTAFPALGCIALTCCR